MERRKSFLPARLSLARGVSVLRGDGSNQGVLFIDDHIHTSEVIVDYLTEYSGVKCTVTRIEKLLFDTDYIIKKDGDLDPHLSRYTLTPLKVVRHKKLRWSLRRSWLYIYRPWAFERFPYNQ